MAFICLQQQQSKKKTMWLYYEVIYNHNEKGGEKIIALLGDLTVNAF